MYLQGVVNMGDGLRELHKLKEAHEQLADALARLEELFGKEHPTIALACRNLGMVLLDEGKASEALPLLERAVAVGEKTRGPKHIMTGYFLEDLGRVYIAVHRYPEATGALRRSLAIIGENDDAIAAQTRMLLADALREQGQATEALPLAETALRFLEAHPIDTETLSDARFALARALWDSKGDQARARALAASAEKDNEDPAAVRAWLSAHP
jgi:tetratricopeptide (TPR) repeat protein